ncbi:MAG: amidohydrolase family protein, partial [Alphaproteobacteria bacterium]
MSDLILLRNATIIDAQHAEPREGFDVLIEGDRIREVSQRPLSAGTAVEFDLHGRTLMPGLIDAHAHVYLTEVDLRRLAHIPITLIAARATVAMRQMLDRGFTTVRDAGGADWGIKEAVELNLIPGPRLFISGQALSQTGGHGDFRARTQSDDPCGCGSALGLTSCIADGVAGVQKAAREQLRQGADQIKIMVSGGISSPHDPFDSRQYTTDEIRAVVGEAEAWNTYVLAHAYTPEAIRHAAEAGVRSIEHGNLIDAP